jgi:anti-anti-sigma factor
VQIADMFAVPRSTVYGYLNRPAAQLTAAAMNVDTGPWAHGVAHLSVAGEIDIATVDVLAEALREALTRAGTIRVVVDFASVTFCDSSGLAALDNAYAHAAAKNTVLRSSVCSRRCAGSLRWSACSKR